MALIARDLMVGNPKLAEMGFGEEAHGHNAIAPASRASASGRITSPTAIILEAILNTSFDWNGIRAPYIVATENDCLNGASMLFGYLLTNTAQIFADVRTYWSPNRCKRVSGHTLDGAAAGGILHLINSGPATLDGTGQMERDGQPAMKPFWEITKDEAQKCLAATTWHPSITEYFPGGGWSTRFLTRGGMPVTMCRLNLVKGLGPALQIAEGVHGGSAGKGPRRAGPAHESDLADDLVRAEHHRPRRVPRRLHGDEQLGREPRRHQLRPHRRGLDFARGHAAHSGLHAQRGERPDFPSQHLGGVWHADVWKARTIAPARISARFTRES